MEAFKTMCPDLSCNDLLLNEDLSDVRVIVENNMERVNFPAHSLVLKRRSPVLAKMLESDFIEGQTQTIQITDFKAIHMEMFLRFLYTDELPEMYTGLCELVKIADKYLVSKLTERCVESLLRFVNLQNVYELCELADTYSLEKLLDRCRFLVKRAAFRLLKYEDSKCLSRQIMETIVRADDLNVTREMDVLLALWSWGFLKLRYQGMDCSNENVREFIADLLKYVRWSLIYCYNEKEKIKSLGITVDDADFKEKCQYRESSTKDTQWFLNQCDILQTDEYSSSRIKLLIEHFPSIADLELMHAVSLCDLPFYVVGVLVTLCVKKGDSFPETLVCSCGSSSSTARKAVPVETPFYIANNTIEGSKMTSQEFLMVYAEVMYEFPNPVEVGKHEQFLIKIRSGSNCGSVQLKFHRQVVHSYKGKGLFVDGDVLGIKKIFLL